MIHAASVAKPETSASVCAYGAGIELELFKNIKRTGSAPHVILQEASEQPVAFILGFAEKNRRLIAACSEPKHCTTVILSDPVSAAKSPW